MADLKTELRKIADSHNMNALEQALHNQSVLNSIPLAERTQAFTSMWDQYSSYEFAVGATDDVAAEAGIRKALASYGLHEWTDYLLRPLDICIGIRFETAEGLAIAKLAIGEK